MLELEDVGYWILEERTTRRLFQGLRAVVQSGSVGVACGPPGCGKSTLVDVVLGVRRPMQGRVRIHGVDLHQLSARRLADWRRRRVAWLPPPRTLAPHRRGPAALLRLQQWAAQAAELRVLDEPTRGLSRGERREWCQAFRSLRGSFTGTTLITTHSRTVQREGDVLIQLGVPSRRLTRRDR